MAVVHHCLIATAEPAERMRLGAMFSELSYCVSFCGDGRDIPDLLRSVPTDVLLMHLVLPGIDGLGVIERLHTAGLELTPGIVLLYHRGMEHFADIAMRAGAYRCLPTDAADADIVAACAAVGPDDRLYASEPSRGDIMRIVAELGFPAGAVGSQYLQTALLYTLSDYRLLRDKAHTLYPLTAARCGTDPAAVERGIRHAIESAWQTGAHEKQYELFGNTIDEKRGKPTNGGLLARLTEYLRAKERFE